MLDYFESIRQRPKSYRRKFALVLSASVTAVVAVVWLLTIPVSYGVKEESKSVNGVAPWEGIKNASATLIKSVKQGVSDVRGVFSSDGGTTTPEAVLNEWKEENESTDSAGNLDENIVY